MDARNSKSNGKPPKDLRQFSLMMTIPAIMFAAPAVGFFIGRWADGKFGTEPYLMVGGVVLGFIAGGVETYELIKRASALDKDNEDD